MKMMRGNFNQRKSNDPVLRRAHRCVLRGLSWRPLWATGLVGLGCLSALAQDDPDLRIERNFHIIYRKYNEAPTSQGKWEEVLSHARDKNYVIQKGDTLWDISQTFFGDPQFWPKVWSLNPDIYNPHEILPRGSVRFVMGAENEPPQMGLAKEEKTEAEEQEEEGAAAEEGESPEAETEKSPASKWKVLNVDLSEVVLPPPGKKSRPPNALPGSLPPYVYFRNPLTDVEMELTTIKRSDTENVPVTIPYFVSGGDLNSVGRIEQTESGSNVAAERESVLVKGAGAQTGARLLVVRRLGTVNMASGNVNQVQGEIVVGSPVNSAEGLFRAQVIKALTLVTLDSQLLSEPLPVMVPSSVSQMTAVPGEIIGGQFSTRRRLFGPFAVVFLNIGAAKGLTVGSHLPVYRNPRVRVPDSLVKENPAEIGELQIARVEEGVATAVVLKALDEIRVGDVTSPGL
ncbi:MAG: hypothetical protein C5B49_01005 [Bdellovibrio sp.]|nr:MAG: hypothetical protein C5B49_01005 [Bdellovibrio sp.]